MVRQTAFLSLALVALAASANSQEKYEKFAVSSREWVTPSRSRNPS